MEPGGHRKVHLRGPREVPSDVGRGEVWVGALVPPNLRGDEIRQVDRDVRGGSFLHQKRLVPVGLSEVHRNASNAPSRRCTASGVCRPVVAKSAASLSSGSCRVSGRPPWMPLSRSARWTGG